MTGNPGARKDPTAEFKFAVEIGGIVEAVFTECSGLTIERKPFPYQEGGVNDFVHQLPGRVEYTNIVLKRGMTLSRELWDWFQEGLYDGKVKRLNPSIILYARDGSVAQRWNVIGAYPIKWTGPVFKTESTSAAVETLELAHHGIQVS